MCTHPWYDLLLETHQITNIGVSIDSAEIILFGEIANFSPWFLNIVGYYFFLTTRKILLQCINSLAIALWVLVWVGFIFLLVSQPH